jgi:hypothetical protein
MDFKCPKGTKYQNINKIKIVLFISVKKAYFTVLINSLIDTVFVHIFMCIPFHDFGNTCTLKFMCIYICDNMKISIADKYRLLHGIFHIIPFISPRS